MKNIYITSSVVLLALVLAFSLYLPVSAQSSRWYGSPGSPYWNKTWQGSTLIYGTVACDATTGTVFLTGSSNFRQSLLLRNDDTQYIVVCPVGVDWTRVTGTGGTEETTTGACNELNGFKIGEAEALVLDKSNRAASTTGWKCFGDSGTATLRYIAEGGY